MPQPKVQTAGKRSAEPGSREPKSEGELEKGEGELKSEGDRRGEGLFRQRKEEGYRQMEKEIRV